MLPGPDLMSLSEASATTQRGAPHGAASPHPSDMSPAPTSSNPPSHQPCNPVPFSKRCTSNSVAGTDGRGPLKQRLEAFHQDLLMDENMPQTPSPCIIVASAPHQHQHSSADGVDSPLVPNSLSHPSHPVPFSKGTPSLSYIPQFQRPQPPTAPATEKIIQALFALSKTCILCVCSRTLGTTDPHSAYWKCPNLDEDLRRDIKTKLHYRNGSNGHCWTCHLPDDISDAEHRGSRHGKWVEACTYGDIVREVVYFSWRDEVLQVHLIKLNPQISVMTKGDFRRWLAQSFDDQPRSNPTHVWVCFLSLLPHLPLPECQRCFVSS